MNKVILHGRCTRDPEVRTTQSGNMVARLSIAVDRYAKQGEGKKADFIGCVAWGKTAESIGKYFVKGKEILVEGRIQTDSYEAQDGTKRYTTDVVIDRWNFCGSGGEKRDSGGGFPPTDDIPF